MRIVGKILLWISGVLGVGLLGAAMWFSAKRMPAIICLSPIRCSLSRPYPWGAVPEP